ncbi:MAG: hypothetical protein AAFR05_12905 [Bacteroidota bacterium]
MIYIRIRYLLILLFMIIGVSLHLHLGIGSAWYCYAASVLLYVTYYLFGTVGPAFSKLRQGKLAEAERLIKMIRRPEYLLKRHRAYYHFTKGMIAMQKKELRLGEVHLKAALDQGLRNATDKALASLNLAHIHFVQHNKAEARRFLDRAKTFDSNDLLIREKISELERALAAPMN